MIFTISTIGLIKLTEESIYKTEIKYSEQQKWQWLSGKGIRF